LNTLPNNEKTTATKENDIILEVKNLGKFFPIQKGWMRKTIGYVKAVDEVSFTVRPGETLSLVGESRCGKTTICSSITRLINPTTGEALFRTRILSPDGHERVVDLVKLPPDQMKLVLQEIAMIFQDPDQSLNPRMSVAEIITEPLTIHGRYEKSSSEDLVVQLLQRVGLRPDHLRRYPREFSGGQQQKIGIARALTLNPRLVICDDPVSALDASIQARILSLLQDLQDDLNLAYIFTASEFSLVRHISDRVGVVYAGKIVEMADTQELYTYPLHPYTAALMYTERKTQPMVRSDGIRLPDNVANPASLPAGCYFHPRCRFTVELCKGEAPVFRELKPGHFVACHRAEELELQDI
jgi:peptide/nickel transport system ATP-binding protein